jgi:hypothetical protein
MTGSAVDVVVVVVVDNVADFIGLAGDANNKSR